MTEDTPSRSYVLREGGFRDPIGEAVLNAGRKGEMGEGVGIGLNGKRRRQKPPDQQEDPRPTPLPMPGSFPLTQTQTQTQTQTTRQPPYLPLPHPTPNANANPNPNPFPTPQLILPSMLPPPPPIQIPEMQPLPKFQPVPEPIWERPSGGKSEAERFKEQYMGGVARVEGNGVPEGARRRRRKGRKEEVLDVAGGGARVGDGLSNQTQTQTQMQPQLQTQSQTQAQTQNQPSDPPAPPNPQLTSKEERHQLRRQKRRSRAAAAAGLADLAGTGAGAGPGEQDPPAIRRGGRLGRGASMRRRNVWDDVPEFANPNEQISSPPHPIPTVQEEEEDPIHHPHSHSLTFTEPAPPPFPYPTTGTGRLPPPFDVNVHGAEGPVQMGRWSPPPRFEEVVNAREADDVQQEAEEEDDGEEEIPPSPSTTSSVQAERIRRESPRERRKREERERWIRQRETGVDLEIMVGREKERIQRMGHWDALMGSRNQTRETLVPPDNEGGLEVQEMRDGDAGSANEVIKEEGRYSKEEKGKGRAIYYDAPDRALGEDVPGPGVSRASSVSTNVGTALEEPHEDEQEELKTYPTVHRVQLADDQVGEGSKVSGFVMRELVAAGIDLSEIVPEQEEEQEVDLPPSSTRENAGSPTTPKANAQPLATPTIREEGELMEDPTTSPLLHGSKFVEAITEKDGEIETVPGMLGSPITQTEPDSMETDTPPAVPEKDEPTVTAKSPGITRKPSLPPLFSRRRTSARKISNPWALFRQGSMSNKNKDASRPDDQTVSSPTAETAEVSSPKETGLSKSPFFKAASALLRPGLGIENAKKEKEKEPDVPTSPPVEAPQPLPVTDGLIPTRSRQVSSSSIPTATGQPFVVYKHPFNRAVKPAWMQQPAPVWRDPRAYVMTDTDAPIATPMSLEEKEDSIAIKVEEVSQEEEWEVVPPVKAVPLPRRVSDRKPPPPAPVRRAEVQFNAFPLRAYPPPVLATNRDSSDESSDTSDTGSNLTADSDTSSDEWSVSDAVPRPPAAYRLLPPKGIPANVLRASNEPPPLPRRNRENRPRPLGPRARGVPPPLPPRLGAGGPAQSVATPSAPAPVTVPVRSVETPVAIAAVKQLAAPIQVESGVPTPPAPTRAPPPPPATRPGKSHGLSSRAAKPPPLEIPSSTRPTTGHRTPSGVSTPRINSAKPEDRVRTRSFNGNGLKPLSTTVPLDQPQSSVQPKEYAPLPQAVPFVFSQPKPLRLNNAPLPLFAQSRPKPVHSKTTPNERKGKSRLQIKPRFDDRPEQELKSQLSNRVNKWRLNAVHPDPPELYNPEDDEEEDTQGGGAGGTEGGMSRTVSMPNVLSGVSLQRKEETVKPTVQPVVPMVTVPTAPPPVTQAAPEPAAAETTANTTVTTPSPPNEPRRRTTSRSYAKKPEAGPSSPTAPIVTQPARVQPVTNGSSMAPDANGIEYTDLDLVAAQLQGTDREYEGMHAITSFVGEEVPRGATPDALSNLMLAPVEVESKRTTKDGKTKLKLSALGVRVLKCSVCLSQFKAGDIMAMMPKCGHVGHQRCVVNWLTSDARCMVCREPL